ncbi:hypothetical protein P886_1967 [Alteromonadaceae bacterium 2753L.S.0a.02]|nr:hypothetical protein P886_1967 [Alteromonadaceae bacterium 2753L.S.0a.02]
MIGAFFFVAFICLLLYGYSRDLKKKWEYELEIERALEKAYSSLKSNKSDYTSYLNNGHILHRSERKDIEKELKSSIRDYVSKYQIFKKPNFCFSIDEEGKRIIFLNQTTKFDLNNYVYYEEWKQGDSELKKRIEKYNRENS